MGSATRVSVKIPGSICGGHLLRLHTPGTCGWLPVLADLHGDGALTRRTRTPRSGYRPATLRGLRHFSSLFIRSSHVDRPLPPARCDAGSRKRAKTARPSGMVASSRSACFRGARAILLHGDLQLPLGLGPVRASGSARRPATIAFRIPGLGTNAIAFSIRWNWPRCHGTPVSPGVEQRKEPGVGVAFTTSLTPCRPRAWSDPRKSPPVDLGLVPNETLTPRIEADGPAGRSRWPPARRGPGPWPPWRTCSC